MKHLIFFILLLFFSLFLQSYFDLLSIAGIKPDLLLILTIYISFKEGTFRGVWTGFTAGLLQDLVSSASIGFHAMPKAIIGYIVGKFGNLVRGQSLFSLGLLIFVISLMHGILLLLLALLFIDGKFSYVYKIILPESLYNAILGPMLFTIFDKIFGINIVGGDSV